MDARLSLIADELTALDSMYGLTFLDDSYAAPALEETYLLQPSLIVTQIPAELFQMMGRESSCSSFPNLNEDNGEVRIEVRCPLTVPEEGVVILAEMCNESHTLFPNGALIDSDTLATQSKETERIPCEVGEVKCWLPPLSISICLGLEYPSAPQKIESIESIWLGVCKEKVGKISRLLMDMIHEGPCLFEWLSALETGVDLWPLVFEEGEKARLIIQGRDALPKCRRILNYDRESARVKFLGGTHVCQICLELKAGQDFSQLVCGHWHCKTCLQEMASCHILSGSISDLRCPTITCHADIENADLQPLLDVVMIERLDVLQLEKAIRKMEGACYCPRCEASRPGSNVLCLADEDGCALCPGCSYAFCMQCLDAWHGGGCGGEEGEGMLRPGTGQVSAAQLFRKKQTSASLQLIRKNAKQCPTCRTGIEKDGGCNKVTCIECRNTFCWLCRAPKISYEHFKDGACKLFTEDDIRRYNNLMAQRVEREFLAPPDLLELGYFPGDQRAQAQQLRRVRCPNCGRVNVKGALNNNHMRCWSCQTGFCYRCREELRRGMTSKHYPKACPQHSDD